MHSSKILYYILLTCENEQNIQSSVYLYLVYEIVFSLWNKQYSAYVVKSLCECCMWGGYPVVNLEILQCWFQQEFDQHMLNLMDNSRLCVSQIVVHVFYLHLIQNDLPETILIYEAR